MEFYFDPSHIAIAPNEESDEDGMGDLKTIHQGYPL